jgi:hypothetical protein
VCAAHVAPPPLLALLTLTLLPLIPLLAATL